jgi:uncharacterized protein
MRIGRIILPVAAGGAAALTGASAWVIADRMLTSSAEALANEDPDPDAWVRVVRVDGDAVVLDGPGAGRPGRWGLAWSGGYAQIGEVTEWVPDGVVRPLRPLPDTPEPGAEALLDVDAYPNDPSVLDVAWEEVAYHSPAGRLPAWAIPADDESGTWAILVHGRTGRRRQGLKFVPALRRDGISCLLIAFRGDHDAPDAGDGTNHLGAAEWEDVEGAVVYALARGARDIVLLGASMGGTAVLTFLRMSSHATHVRAVILDAPVLDWPEVLRARIRRLGAPRSLATTSVAVAQGIGRIRAGIDWDTIDHLRNASAFRHPMLVVHGDDDVNVPVGASEELARRRPEIVALHRVSGAGHLAGWNIDPDGVETAIAELLASTPRRPARSVADRARSAVASSIRAARRSTRPRR